MLADNLINKITQLLENANIKDADDIIDWGMQKFKEDWRFPQQKAIALLRKNSLTDAQNRNGANLLAAALYYQQAAELVVDVNLKIAFISSARGLLVNADKILSLDISTLLLASNTKAEKLVIPITTLPKSGSAYIYLTLSTALNLRPERISTSSNGMDFIDNERLQNLMEFGGWVSQGHFHPTYQNLAALNANIKKLIIHIRDPRETVLSWAHYLSQPIAIKNLEINEKYKNISQLSFEEKIEKTIDIFYPGQINYINSWVEAIENRSVRFECLVLNHTLLKENPKDYFKKITDFFEINQNFEIFPIPPEKGKLHFRESNKNEWRDVLSKSQIHRLNLLMNKKIAKKFDWTE